MLGNRTCNPTIAISACLEKKRLRAISAAPRVGEDLGRAGVPTEPLQQGGKERSHRDPRFRKGMLCKVACTQTRGRRKQRSEDEGRDRWSSACPVSRTVARRALGGRVARALFRRVFRWLGL